MNAHTTKKEEIRRGIAAYKREQQVLLRLIRRTGGLTATKFDELFVRRELKRPGKAVASSRESYILGIAVNGFNTWAWYLDLLQMMVMAGEVDIVKRMDQPDEIFYMLPDQSIR